MADLDRFTRFQKLIRFWFLVVVGLISLRCGSSDAGTGQLEVRVHDHREAIGDFETLVLTILNVGIHPAYQPREEGWIILEPLVQRLDLTEYVDGRDLVIVRAETKAETYDAMRLVLEGAEGELKDGRPVDVVIAFETVALDFRPTARTTTILDLDLVVLDMSDHPGQGYELHLLEAVVKK